MLCSFLHNYVREHIHYYLLILIYKSNKFSKKMNQKQNFKFSINLNVGLNTLGNQKMNILKHAC